MNAEALLSTAIELFNKNIIMSKELPAKIVLGADEVLGFAVFMQTREPEDLSRIDPSAPGSLVVLAIAKRGEELRGWRDVVAELRKLAGEGGEEAKERALALLEEVSGEIASILSGRFDVSDAIMLLVKAAEITEGVGKVYSGASIKVKAGDKAYMYRGGVGVEIKNGLLLALAPINEAGREVVETIEGALLSKFADRAEVLP